MKIVITVTLILFALLQSSIANGQANEAVTSELSIFKVFTQNGKEISEEITKAQPGDTVEYRLVYTNNLKTSISNLKPVLPVPEGTIYLVSTAQPNLATASLRSSGGVGFEPLPIIRKDTLSGGEIVEREVPATEYRRLQWNISSLDGGEKATFKARMRVQSNN